MHNASSCLLVYGLRKSDDRIVSINDVSRGKECGCVCPKCGVDLLARKGDINEHHFAHSGDAVCRWAPETALHQLAKQIIAESKVILLPGGNQLQDYKCEIEPTIDRFRPDALLRAEGKIVWVEVFVCAEVTIQKNRFLEEQIYEAMEIDLADLPRNITIDELRPIVLDHATRRRRLSLPAQTRALETGFSSLWGVVLVPIALLIVTACLLLRKKR